MHPNDGRVVSNFIVQALLGRDVTVFGDRQQIRSFCYVDDLIDGLLRLMNTPNEVIGAIDLGNPKEITILGLAFGDRVDRLALAYRPSAATAG